jgi:hypothetical protein
LKRSQYEKDSKLYQIVCGEKTSDNQNPYIEACRVPSAGARRRGDDQKGNICVQRKYLYANTTASIHTTTATIITTSTIATATKAKVITN